MGWLWYGFVISSVDLQQITEHLFNKTIRHAELPIQCNKHSFRLQTNPISAQEMQGGFQIFSIKESTTDDNLRLAGYEEQMAADAHPQARQTLKVQGNRS